MREGKPSIRFGHLGVHNICLGPNAATLIGPRLKIVMYNDKDEIVRRLEEIEGECIDPGYVDFFNSPACRPAKHQHYLIDIGPDGKLAILHDDPFAFMCNPQAWIAFVGEWANKHYVAPAAMR